MKSTPKHSDQLALKLVRPIVRKLHGYVPGEQPKVRGLVKLNTNENPYPPSPKVLEAISNAANERLRLYPNPSAESLRVRLAKLHRCKIENIIVGNGSDELLALAVRAFCEPYTEAIDIEGRKVSGSEPFRIRARSMVQAFSPSYSLYPVLAEIHGAVFHEVPLGPDFDLPAECSHQALTHAKLKSKKNFKATGIAGWDRQAALSFITTPNAPTGRAFRTEDLDSICVKQDGVVVLDEAYVDFAEDNAMSLALKHPNTIVARTFSKAYSLCALRVGYMVGHPILIDALHRIRDSYNVNLLGQLAAVATLSDLAYYRSGFKKVVATRERVTRELAVLGFRVFPSQANFILVEPPAQPAQRWLEDLRSHKILVRWFKQPEISRFLRISIGSESEMEYFLKVTRLILRKIISN